MLLLDVKISGDIKVCPTYLSRLSKRTYSLWSYMSGQWLKYLNPYYDERYNSGKGGMIIPSLSPQNIK